MNPSQCVQIDFYMKNVFYFDAMAIKFTLDKIYPTQLKLYLYIKVDLKKINVLHIFLYLHYLYLLTNNTNKIFNLLKNLFMIDLDITVNNFYL